MPGAGLKCRVPAWSGWHLPFLPASWSSPGAPTELSTCPKHPRGRAHGVDAVGCAARLWRGAAGTREAGAERWVLLPTSPPCTGAHPRGGPGGGAAPPWLKERLYPQDGAHACQIFSGRPRGGRNEPMSGCSAHLGSCPGSRAKGWELLLALPVLVSAGPGRGGGDETSGHVGDTREKRALLRGERAGCRQPKPQSCCKPRSELLPGPGCVGSQNLSRGQPLSVPFLALLARGAAGFGGQEPRWDPRHRQSHSCLVPCPGLRGRLFLPSQVPWDVVAHSDISGCSLLLTKQGWQLRVGHDAILCASSRVVLCGPRARGGHVSEHPRHPTRSALPRNQGQGLGPRWPGPGVWGSLGGRIEASDLMGDLGCAPSSFSL